jgi:hypothetical protein
MWSKRTVLSAIAGLSLLGISVNAMAWDHYDRPSGRVRSMWYRPSQHRPIVLAQEYPYQWRHHEDPPLAPNDYNWGSRYRYQYAPGWFSAPPSGWAVNQRRAYLEQRRQVAINMQQQMLARGDTNAAQRLGGVIGQLDNQLHYR